MPYPSHYNACAGYANMLRKKGWRTVATVSSVTISDAELQGFEVVNWDYILEHDLSSIRQVVGHFLREVSQRNFFTYRYKEFYKQFLTTRGIVNQLKPDVLYIDIHIGYYFCFWNLPSVFLHTKLSSRMHSSIYPFICDSISMNSFICKMLSFLKWKFIFLNIFIKKILRKFAFLNRDEDFFLKRIAERNNYDWKSIYDPYNLLYDNWRNVSRLILCPISFDYPWYKPNRIDTHLWFPSECEPNKVLIDNLLPNTDNLSIIYVAFGSSSNQSKLLSGFYTTLIKIVIENPNYYLILSAGYLSSYLNQYFSNDRVCIKPHVSQRQILPFCDLFITHAGLNSVKESIQFGIPMLAYPLNRKVDQPGNAARIVYHGLGLKGKLKKDSLLNIQNKITEILTNKSFKYNCKLMQQRFKEECSLNQIIIK